MRDSVRLLHLLRQTTTPILAVLVAALFSSAASASPASTLFAFNVSPNGNTPSTELVADESGYAYGTTEAGGDPRTGGGVVFRIAPGGALEVLHRFGTVPFDGLRPLGRLLYSGGRLYGTTSAGGAGARGTLFALEADGTGYEILHDFGARAGDGMDPRAGVTAFSGRLWGTTFVGGRRGSGTVFSFDPEKREYAVVVDFDPSSSTGFHPDEPVAFADGRGFGIASEGGAAGKGAIFSFLPDGSAVAGVHAFDVSVSNGYLPDGPLTASGSVLYGVTDGGGPKGVGIVYAVGSDGGGFRIVHAFGGGSADGAEPAGALLVADGVIYGTTAFGGAADWGVAYALKDGGDFSVLHSFPTDGSD
ncbi:MAG TPA: choice-of-anchor tandem repeat GloVer-containing protein, partial [Thermoanaerobaculia bacterium]|nr:choice-of-anchor tandem repeat GloVer-containing protein [Thermoanaerobaculia bacterium]